MAELRARDIRYKLQGVVDPRLMNVLEELAEQQWNIVKHVTTLAAMVDQMADITKAYVQVAERMKSTVDSMNKGAEDDLSPNSTNE